MRTSALINPVVGCAPQFQTIRARSFFPKAAICTHQRWGRLRGQPIDLDRCAVL